MMWSFFTAIAILLNLMVCCEGRGQVIVKITSYKNPFQRDFNGECCDPIFFGCSNGCDAYFKLCVTLSPSKSVYNCNLGKYETDVVGSKASYRFSEDRYKKSFPFNSFQERVNLNLEVWDKDKLSDDDLVDNIKESVELRVTFANFYKQLVTLSGRRATVTLQLEVHCAKNYYGPTCSCSPQDDLSGHYTCDNQGRKVCRPHWYGGSCTRRCIPRNDPFNGHFNCDEQGNKICLPRFEGPYCKRCVKNWFGPRCSTYCVPQDSHGQGHYNCGRFDGRKDCLPWWFGSECKAHCIPHDDDVNGHYSCAPDGNKTCLARWFGENCTVFCVPRDDERGHYTCDKEGYRVCLDGYRPPECLNCLLGRYGANCSLTCLGNDTSTFQQGSYYCTDDGAKNCNRWWHGPTCSQYCVPHDDSMHGHYTCDERDGSKVCRLGWEGSSCLDRNQK